MIKRFFRELDVIDRMKISLGTFLFAIPVVGKALLSLFKVNDRIMNLLAIMETELSDCILQMEEELRNNNGGQRRRKRDFMYVRFAFHYSNCFKHPESLDLSFKPL